jgi:hypothetical protein
MGYMRRFISNRWWAFALAIAVGIAGTLFLPASSRAGSGNGSGLMGDPGGGPPGDPGPTGSGDPDSPSNTRTASRSGKLGRVYVAPLSARGTEVSAAGTRTMTLRIQIALHMFRFYLLRF